MLITVFTPAYNRGYIIGKLYESLKKQTFKDFEWLIVDDGSTDNTAALISGFQRNQDFFSIRYIRTENGGKHRAINKGIQLAEGKLFFIVDSDDCLPGDALEIVCSVDATIDYAEKENFAGLCGLKSSPSGIIIGNAFDSDVFDATTIEMNKRGIYGDKAEVFYTNVLNEYRFPEFEGENFCTESIVWDRIAHGGLKMRYFNKSIYTCDYLEDGLTHQGYRLYANNPKQWGLSICQDYEFGKSTLYGKSLEIYKYYLWENNRLSMEDMAEYLHTKPFVVKLYVSIHALADILRRTLGKTTIKEALFN